MTKGLRECGAGNEGYADKDKGCCGRKALKKLPALFIIHPVSQDWIIPRKTTAEINNTALGRSRSEDQGSHDPTKPFADYGRNTLKLYRYIPLPLYIYYIPLPWLQLQCIRRQTRARTLNFIIISFNIYNDVIILVNIAYNYILLYNIHCAPVYSETLYYYNIIYIVP